MEAVARLPARLARESRPRIDPAAIAAWFVPLLLVLYLGLNNGGYDVIERSEAGIVVWWIVLVGALVGAFPVAGATRLGYAMFGLLFAFAAWTALSVIWTESAERTVTELGRVATYLGVFALALVAQGHGRWRHLLHGLTAGIWCVVGIAVLSRLQPEWFPEQVTGQFLPGTQIESRLAYPLNYSSGLAALGALSLPMMLAAASSAKTLVMQALAVAGIPVVVLALWLTGSSLSVPLAALGLLVFLALAPDRLPKLGSLALGGVGATVLIAAAAQREALERGPTGSAAHQQGDELMVFLLVVCVGVGLAQAGLGLAVRYGNRPRWLVPSPRTAAIGLAVGAVAILVAGVAAGAPARLGDAWDEFRAGDAADAKEVRGAEILDVSSNGRYQFWESAVDANQTEPLLGIGPGTFEFWWAREGSQAIFIRDSHSLYMDAFAELGFVGLILIGAFTVGVLIIGAARALRSAPELRLGLAAATAAATVFVAGAAVDWMWELGTLAAVFVMLAAIMLVAGARESGSGSRDGVSAAVPDADGSLRRRLPRVAAVVVSLAALVAIAIPLATTSALTESQDQAGGGGLDAALREARTAVALEPYAASPRLQEALVLERQGDLPAAAQAAREAVRREATNWRTWLILSRLEARLGNAQPALDAFRTARSLNPRSEALAG